MRDAIERADRAVIQLAFQPLQDWVSQQRQRADHALAIVAFGASFVFVCVRLTLFPSDYRIGDVVALGLLGLLYAVLMLALWAYGVRVGDVKAAPGYMNAWALPRLLMVVIIVMLWPLVLLQPEPEDGWRILSDVTLACGYYFGGCDLKRPPPKRERQLAYAYGDAQ